MYVYAFNKSTLPAVQKYFDSKDFYIITKKLKNIE